MNEEQHHVAWADRIGLNKLWAKDILSCSEAYGSSFYEMKVKCFRNDIINIKNGPQLKTEIDSYVNDVLKKWKDDVLEEWINNNPKEASSTAWIRKIREDINQRACEYLCNFMIQLLEDHGFGFYESNLLSDDGGLDRQ